MNARSLLCILALVAAVSPLGACAREPYVELKGETFEVELAETEPTRQMGLMFRDSLPEDRGMLFIFEDEAPRSFWMKNTRIPLDILYFDDDFRLVSMQQDVPPCRVPRCPGYPSEGPARYVLELNAGTARRLGVAPGDRLAFER